MFPCDSLTCCPEHVHDGPPRLPVDLMRECVYILSMFESILMPSYITLYTSVYSRIQLFPILVSLQMRRPRRYLDSGNSWNATRIRRWCKTVVLVLLSTTPEPIVSQIHQNKHVSIYYDLWSYLCAIPDTKYMYHYCVVRIITKIHIKR